MSAKRSEALSLTARKVAILFVSAVLMSTVILLSAPSHVMAKPITLVEKTNVKVGNTVSKWYYSTARDQRVAATISKGVRKDTSKVVRTVRNEIKGVARGISLDIAKEITLTYEVYTSGPQLGKIYRINKPQIKHLSKNARYLSVFNLSVSPKVEVVAYHVNKNQSATVRLREQTTFTLPRQFPLKRDVFSELLRKSFNIQSKPIEHTFTILPQGQYGTVQLELGG